jgi:carboxymethylenebutenolidase
VNQRAEEAYVARMALRDYLTSEVTADFSDGLLTRREALRRLVLLGVSVGAAGALLAACGGGDDDDAPSAGDADADAGAGTTTTSGEAATTTTAGKTVGAANITFPGPKGELQAAFAEADDPKGGLLLIHENRGLTDHFGELARRFAALGYTSLAVDLLSDRGGTGALADPAEAPAGLSSRPMADLVADLRAGIAELRKRVGPSMKLAAMGFCFGGGLSWQLVQEGVPELAAIVPFYGPAPDPADFTKSKAAVLGIYGELDARVNASRDRATAALQAAKLTHEIKTFAGADHAFFNDTGARYNEAAAKEAQAAVLSWFERYLG